MFIVLQNCFNISEIKLSPASYIIFFGNPCSEKITLHASIKLSADMSSAFFHNWEFAVVIDNAKVVFVI